MSDSWYEKHAQLVVHYSIGVKENETVRISGPVVAEPLIKEIYHQVLLAGGHPVLDITLEECETLLYHVGSDQQLDFLPCAIKCLAEEVDCAIFIGGMSNPRRLANVPQTKLIRRIAAFKESNEIMDKREELGEFRWNGSPFATFGMAQQAKIARFEYEALIQRALFLDKADPVAEWKALAARQQRFVDYLNKKKHLHILGDDIDLHLSVADRTWVNAAGQSNLPDGEIYTAPVENSATGHILFKFPKNIKGKDVENLRLTFEKGKIIDAQATKGEDELEFIFKIPGADRLGEIGIGTNSGITQITHNILFDEKMGGTLHLALGQFIPGTGGTNESTIHFDILAQPTEIYADGELFWKKGTFEIE
jgi:aminopeptidase